MNDVPICGVHGTPMTWKEPGVSKAGKPYQGFWSCGQKDANGNWCKFKPDIKDTPVAKFNDELNQMNALDKQSAKDDLITRTAIVKSMIEGGAKYGLESIKECEQWFKYCKEGSKTLTAPNLASESQPEDMGDDLDAIAASFN